MIDTDRNTVRLYAYHPSSSLVINNPSRTFAVLFEISIVDCINDQTSTLKSLLGIESFETSPIRGIILPQDSQLIKLSAIIPSQSQYQIQKRIKKKNLPSEIEVAQLNIACSYHLEYNKQRIAKQQQKNGLSLFGVENIEQNQTRPIKIMIETQKRRETIARRNTLIDEFKKHLESIHIDPLQTSRELRQLKEKPQINFENSKLNEDFNFAKNQLTLSELQKIKSNQTKAVSDKQIVLHYPQSKIKIQLPSDKQWKDQHISKKEMAVYESMVVESFRPAESMFVQTKNQAGGRSMELLALAILSAIFVSLGSHFRAIFFAQ